MKNWLIFKDIVLFAIAVWGAALSTFNWRRAVKQERRAIRVNLADTSAGNYIRHVDEPFVMLTATNIGQRPVILSKLAFDLPTRERLPLTHYRGLPGSGNTGLPTTLSDGQSAHLYLYYRDIAEVLIESGHPEKTKLTPVAEDSVGQVYRGKPWTIDPKEFASV